MNCVRLYGQSLLIIKEIKFRWNIDRKNFAKSMAVSKRIAIFAIEISIN